MSPLELLNAIKSALEERDDIASVTLIDEADGLGVESADGDLFAVNVFEP